MKFLKVCLIIAISICFLSGCATNPRVTIDAFFHKNKIKTNTQTDQEALKVCHEKYGKNKAVLEQIVTPKNITRTVKIYLCDD